MKASFRRRLAAATVLTLLVAGCGGTASQGLHGRVTLDGKSLPNGQIIFEPRGAGRMAVAQIEDGAYRIQADKTPSPGEYLVRITATRSTGKTAEATGSSGETGPIEVFEQYVPAQYNERSELRVVIAAGQAEPQNFELNSKL